MSNKRTSRPVVSRFWENVQKGDSCWLWLGTIQSEGYGSMDVPGESGRKKILAHRYSFELLRGAIPEGLQLDHLCRNRACVNPDHLEPVTTQENSRRGVPRRGTGVHSAKITESVVRAMRERNGAGESFGSLAEDFGISRTAAYEAVKGLTWKHVT